MGSEKNKNKNKNLDVKILFIGSHIEHHLELFLQVKHFGYNNLRMFDSYTNNRY
jgi:hypothetical protein